MKKLEFTMDKIFTFGNNDVVHRFMIRNHFLNNNPDFKKIIIGDHEKCIITIVINHHKDSIDIDNVPKVIIDSFSGSQIKRDIRDLVLFREGKALSENKQKEYQQIVTLDLFDNEMYESLAVYKDDTIKYIKELHCYANINNHKSINVKVTIEIR